MTGSQASTSRSYASPLVLKGFNPAFAGLMMAVIGLVCLLAIHFDPKDKIAFILCALVTFGVAAYFFIWAPQSSFTFHPARQCVIVVKSTRFGAQHETIPFDNIAAVAVSEHDDTDGDSWPVKKMRYVVELRLYRGEDVEIQTCGPNRKKAYELRNEVAAYLRRHAKTSSTSSITRFA